MTPRKGKPRRVAMAFDTLVCVVAGVALLMAALRHWSDGAAFAFILSLAAATALIATAICIIRRSAAAPQCALIALLLLSALAGWMLFGSADAATPLRPGAQIRDILRAVIPLAFFAWITRDLFIARREGAFDT